LESAIAGLIGNDDPNVIVGLEDGDDASAIRINGDTAVISTADFFTPMLNDPYDWGRVAAANALSDVYAMGGDPITAINLVRWAVARLGLVMLGDVLRGGMEVCDGAGISVTGGHTMTATNPIYDMSVTGIADPAKLRRNGAAAPGRPLTLTNGIGVGI